MGTEKDAADVLERFDAQLDLVQIIARQIARSVGRGADTDDLLSFGREGLLDAARRYDPERGVPFRAYANYRVRGAIIDGMRALAHLPRRLHARLEALDAAANHSEGALEDAMGPQAPGSAAADAERALADHLAGMATAMAFGMVAEAARPGSNELVGGTSSENPEKALAEAELLHVVRLAIENLPPQEAELVRRHYLEGERFDHVARDLGLSKSWASRLHTRAIGRLTKRLRGVAD